MERNESSDLSQEQKENLIKMIKEFKNRTDESFSGEQKKFGWTDLRDRYLQDILERLNLALDCATGQGYIPIKDGFCSMGFFRKDLDKDKYPKKIGQGFYIWLGYYFENQSFELHFGSGEYFKLDSNRLVDKLQKTPEYCFEYKNFQELENQFVDNFLELVKVFNSFSADDFLENKEKQKGEVKMPEKDIPLNQILYGPPGTGKTYHTIDKALEILGYVEWNESEKKFELNEKALEKLKGLPFDTGTMSERDKKKALFDKFMEQGQIGFVTFHQSYGYEDFVEGIRPRLSGENDENQMSEKMEYEIRDGIFKEMCKNAQSFIKQIENKGIDIEITDTTKVWKMSLGDKQKGEAEPLQEHCFKNNEIRIGFDNKEPNEQSSVTRFYEMKPNDIVCVFHSEKEISLVGIISGEVEKDEGVLLPNWNTKYFKRFRKVKWLNTLDDRIDIYALNGNTALTQQTTYELTRIKPIQILERIKKPYILIIDEINRGNISKILGELITLLERSKRKGEKEALEVTLPYSQEPFSVPNNLYIIGTMNTADRSIALLDTALRRRFEFIEMMPDSSKLEKISCDDGKIDLKELLNAINTRIEFLLDRERTIGHSFFFEKAVEGGIEQYELTLTNLQTVFKNKILPLLQEYFYDDYAKINAVLNSNGMLESKTMRDMEISLSDDFVDIDKRVWKITDSSQWKRWNFQKIYDNNAKKNPSPDNTESS
ncbi:AAA family ATPase [Helicobacter cinaedi]|uniref:AAA family ATPase n=1 Tax=Helicobacter cinaedi TaxID=213 RepID=UPI001F36A714|nr:AAA family ATPase [Helicobacter cinaedi]